MIAVSKPTISSVPKSQNTSLRREKMENSDSSSSRNNNKHWRAEEAVAGNAEAVQALRELITFPLLYSREAQKLGLKWPRGLLLHGPPGTGKTSLVRAVVRECGAHLTIISPHSVHRAHAGESERILREAFAEASSHAKLGKPSVVFIDEIDALCPRRDSRTNMDSWNPGPIDPTVLNDQLNHVSEEVYNGTERGNLLSSQLTEQVYDKWHLTDAQKRLLDKCGFGVFKHEAVVHQTNLGLVSALVERWRPETNTFHLNCGEVTITLEDVHFIFGLPVVGNPLTCPLIDNRFLILGIVLGLK